ncbi:DUF4351 domain-containing protein [Clostridium sp. SYSU_GA19001]|uniref:DUF4351 domain-containing protein n=1 Tax=Clostridium caldaquaticum TaxID=2940653 RepID=UPI002077624C|nr:DUF4351 domain-containing protein [Clostridium caldaquaticum]MCM8711798.1 DUF4351 domain-containing protein [Clostridium caldaquaticum]
MRYIFSSYNDMTRNDFEKIAKEIEKTFIEGSENIMTLADIFRKEGLEKGLEEGLEKGRKEGKKEVLTKSVIKLLTKKFGILPNEIKNKIETVDVAVLEIIVEDILEIESIDEVMKYFK